MKESGTKKVSQYLEIYWTAKILQQIREDLMFLFKAIIQIRNAHCSMIIKGSVQRVFMGGPRSPSRAQKYGLS